MHVRCTSHGGAVGGFKVGRMHLRCELGTCCWRLTWTKTVYESLQRLVEAQLEVGNVGLRGGQQLDIQPPDGLPICAVIFKAVWV